MPTSRRSFLAFLLVVLAVAAVTAVAAATETTSRTRKDYRRLKKQDGAIKLVGGERGPFEGNVEILHKNRWGNVCDDEWDELEARVVCKQLGYGASGARATRNAHFGQARRRFWMDGLLCDGTESELARCRFEGWGRTDCQGEEAAGVICEGQQAYANSTFGSWGGRYQSGALNLVVDRQQKNRIRDTHRRGVGLRLAGVGSRQGRVELKLGGGSDWGVVCGDGWSLLEAGVVCRQLGLGYAVHAYQRNMYGSERRSMVASGIICRGDERNIAECLHDTILDCPGVGENVAGVYCAPQIADLVFDHAELERTAHLHDRQLYWLQCAMEENCVASQAYQVQRDYENWHLESRRLLRFTARIINVGNADFRPSVPKHLWEWHMCHMHYHSMEVFATFDVIDSSGRRVAEGHKASFCLEDNQCSPGVQPRYKCANYGDQGISVNCSDIYRYNIDCQWVDITELQPGSYTFKVAVNPELKVGEMSFDNNAATCKLLYTGTYARVHGCTMGRP